MIDRLLGDLSLALLLALPTAALARPATTGRDTAASAAPLIQEAERAEAFSVDRRTSLHRLR
jgi:hypothetical protein